MHDGDTLLERGLCLTFSCCLHLYEVAERLEIHFKKEHALVRSRVVELHRYSVGIAEVGDTQLHAAGAVCNVDAS